MATSVQDCSVSRQLVCEQFWPDLLEPGVYTKTSMATNSTLLCIHRNPAQLASLEENGYELVTATNGFDGLRLLMSRSVDAIVLEHHLGLLDGVVVAAEIKRVKPEVPIVMLAEHLELPEGALKSVDALVTRSDGAHFLWATIHFVLNVKPARHLEAKLRSPVPVHLRRPASSRERMGGNLMFFQIHKNGCPVDGASYSSLEEACLALEKAAQGGEVTAVDGLDQIVRRYTSEECRTARHFGTKPKASI
jgi:CheY-like chemotaxis protein